MAFKEKVIGLVLIILGVWPFVLKIDAIDKFFASYAFLKWLTPGEILYQIIIILLGVLLIWRIKSKVEESR